MNKIRTIFAQSFYAIGDTVWLCHDLTALRLNFPDAVIVTEPPFPEWSGYTLIAPKLNIKYGKFNENDFDFILFNFGDDFSHKFKDQDIVTWNHPKLFKAPNVEQPTTHLIDARYRKLKEIFPGFKLPPIPVMPNITPYKFFPKNLYKKAFITIQTGTSREEKTYSIEKWEIVAKELDARGFNIVYLGGPNDPQPSYVNDNIINMVGKGDLRTTISMIRSGSVHLAGDTGSGHIAAAYRIPVVSLFGGFSYPASCKPYGDDSIIRVIEDAENLAPDMLPSDIVKAASELHLLNIKRKQALNMGKFAPNN